MNYALIRELAHMHKEKTTIVYICKQPHSLKKINHDEKIVIHAKISTVC